MAKKVKYKSAEDKRRALEAEKQWKEMTKTYGLSDKPANTKSLRTISQKKTLSNVAPTYRGSDSKPPSLVTTTKGGGSKVTAPRYTGTLIKGIATMHKSNAVPIIDQEQATEISRMRRG
jgi:hypothetical protein